MALPKVTVLMPVYNGAKYLRESIASILNQTFTDFEFLIIDDGSTDQSVEIITSYNDSRIRLLRNQTNLKLIATLNMGLEYARGEYVARMDCEDISLPERLSKQVAFMEANPGVGVCGTWVEVFGTSHGFIKHPTQSDEIKANLFFDNFLAHPTVMLRTSFFNKFGLRYDPEHLHAEDYGLWVKCSFLFPVANIPEVLLQYRMTPTSIGQTSGNRQRETVLDINKSNIRRLGIDFIDNDYEIHKIAAFPPQLIEQKTKVVLVSQWLQKLQQANQMRKYYPEPYFSDILAKHWFEVCQVSSSFGLWTVLVFWRSPLQSKLKLGWKSKMRFILQCIKGYCKRKLLVIFKK